MSTSISKSKQWLAPVLEDLHSYYWSPDGPAGRTKGDMVTLGKGDWRQALSAFYGSYAFERMGAPPAWGPIARGILDRLPATLAVSDVDRVAWDEFTRRVQKPNVRVNPLSTAGSKPPVTRFIVNLGDSGHNIVRWAANELSSGSASTAWRTLQMLQAIGPKIGSFFLRDVASAHEVDEYKLDDRRSIFPVDLWVRRGIATLSGQHTASLGDLEVARTGLDIADELGVTVASLDAGLWVLGARLARSERQMAAALEDRTELKKLVERELRQAQSLAGILKSIRQEL